MSALTTVVVNFAVGNLDNLPAGGDARKGTLSKVCSSYRVFGHTDTDRISVVCENMDLKNMKTFLSSPESKAARVKNTDLDPIDRSVEADGAA